jgi:hypothetical protein
LHDSASGLAPQRKSDAACYFGGLKATLVQPRGETRSLAARG